MIKKKYLALFMVFVLAAFVYAQYSQDDVLSGIQHTGDVSFDKETSTLDVPAGGYAKIPDNFYGDIHVEEGGRVEVPESFAGSIKANGGIVKLGDAVFAGTGEYSQSSGFTIEHGVLNDVGILNANNVKVYGTQINGIAGKDCQVADQKFGENTQFIYTEEGNIPKVILIGDPETTTLLNGDIRRSGSQYYLDGTDIELDVLNSQIYLKKGDSMKFDGRTLTAKRSDLILVFEETGNSIRPIKLTARAYSDSESPVVIRTEKQIYIVNKDLGYEQNPPVGLAEFEKVNGNLNNNPDLMNFIRQKSLEYGMDQNLVVAMCSAESLCDPKTKPNGDSYGWFQMSPVAVRELNRKYAGEFTSEGVWSWVSVKNDPQANAEAAIAYMALLKEHYNGNVQLMAAAYNAGTGRVDGVKGIPNNKITPTHVKKVLQYMDQNPHN